MADEPIKHESNTDIFRGQIFLFIGGKPMAFGISANLDVSTNEIDISNKMVSAGWDASLAGNKNWTLSSESLVTYTEGQLSATDLLNTQINGQTVDIIYGQALVTEETLTGGKFEPDKSKPYYEGSAFITSFGINSTNGDFAKCSVSLKGSGALKMGTVVAAPAKMSAPTTIAKEETKK